LLVHNLPLFNLNHVDNELNHNQEALGHLGYRIFEMPNHFRCQEWPPTLHAKPRAYTNLPILGSICLVFLYPVDIVDGIVLGMDLVNILENVSLQYKTVKGHPNRLGALFSP
jgi:hypothetical protein